MIAGRDVSETVAEKCLPPSKLENFSTDEIPFLRKHVVITYSKTSDVFV